MPEIRFGDITPSIHNSFNVVRLTHQDVVAGEFPDPLELANPRSLRHIAAQRSRLARHPERYEGAFSNRKLLGYLKANDWRIADELPFATPPERSVLYERQQSGEEAMPTPDFGIFGLVARANLPREQRDRIIGHFLETALERAAERKGPEAVVKVPIHEHDPLLPVALDMGFEATGRWGVAAGAPGLLQQLYRRAVDLDRLAA